MFAESFATHIYTDLLGRAPDATGFSNLVNAIGTGGVINARNVALSIATTPELQNIAMTQSSEATVKSMYRTYLLREPDPSGFNVWVDLYEQQRSVDLSNALYTLTNGLVGSQEFEDLVNGPNNNWYFRGDVSAPISNPDILTGQLSGVSTELDLKSALSSAFSGDVIELAQGAVFEFGENIIIPEGVTLRTFGSPDKSNYQDLARILATVPMTEEFVTVAEGATLDSVWIDGGRNNPTDSNFAGNILNVPVRAYGGSTVNNSRISNSSGYTSISIDRIEDRLSVLRQFGVQNPVDINVDGVLTRTTASISDNLVLAGSSSHNSSISQEFPWTDGISAAYSQTNIVDNKVVNATDVGIILFTERKNNGEAQQSQVVNNEIINTTNSAFSALANDPGVNNGAPGNPDPRNQASGNYSGSSIRSNFLWTSSIVHYDYAISAGTRQWFANTSTGALNGYGMEIVNNSTPLGGSIRANVGIAVSGAINSVIDNNGLAISGTVDTNLNAPWTVVASVQEGYASGIIQGVDTAIYLQNLNNGGPLPSILTFRDDTELAISSGRTPLWAGSLTPHGID